LRVYIRTHACKRAQQKPKCVALERNPNRSRRVALRLALTQPNRSKVSFYGTPVEL